ncbi:rRNA pseudouridine synthase [Candidatus Berkelbacteria bacterium]|nr:rRNA pseudouridine synthase [Candidatus Berkelbacteria bacterium]
MRLNKYIAQQGYASRRKADELIKSSQVKVNNKVVTEMGVMINPDKDKVVISGEPLEQNKQVITTYILNKPKGVVTTASDPQGHKTVLDFVPEKPRVFPCGRLDAETMGLVLLTNDGNLCYQLTHPKFEHKKTYLVEGVCRNPKYATDELKKGVIHLPDGDAKIDDLKVIKSSGNKLNFFITIHEGRNRIVRRICAKLGVEVINLTRTELGEYSLEGIAPGKFKKVS